MFSYYYINFNIFTLHYYSVSYYCWCVVVDDDDDDDDDKIYIYIIHTIGIYNV